MESTFESLGSCLVPSEYWHNHFLVFISFLSKKNAIEWEHVYNKWTLVYDFQNFKNNLQIKVSEFVKKNVFY